MQIISSILCNHRTLRLFVVMLISLLIVPFVASCSDRDEPENTKPSQYTLLVYMVATNSLGGNNRDTQDLEEMEQAVDAGALGTDKRLLVYRVSRSEETPTLFEIKKGKRGVERNVLRTYDATTGVSVTPSRMRQVIADVRGEAPAEHYGLILWSHGTGWARSLTTKSAVNTKDYGDDNGAHMTLDELAEGIPSGAFDFIYADVCYMGCVEVAYELRDRCRYFIGYPSEIPAKGMPYDLTLPLLAKGDITGAAKACYEHYNTQSGQERTMTVAVVDCSALEALAQACRAIQAKSKPLDSTTAILCYNVTGSKFFFDFMQYYRAIAPDEEALLQLEQAYNQTVIYKATTPFIFNRIFVDETRYSAISSYILGASLGVNESYYKTLSWYKTVY